MHKESAWQLLVNDSRSKEAFTRILFEESKDNSCEKLTIVGNSVTLSVSNTTTC